jgi:hypothetical protein
MKSEWKPFDYGNKSQTAPPGGEVVFVFDEYYDGVTLGLFDGFTMRTLPGGSDDCHVTHWATIEYPDAP